MKWIATKLGMERIHLKKKHLKCYFIENQSSTFYASSVFTKILSYAQQHKSGLYLRETEKFVVLNIEDIRSVKEAMERLKELEGFVYEIKEAVK
jgi:transcription-repair coupling factor (superfamily II helicase)